MTLRMRVHDREAIGAALRRFKKLLERSGLTKELRKRKHYEKPCEERRRAKLRKESAIRKGNCRLGPERIGKALGPAAIVDGVRSAPASRRASSFMSP